MSDSKVISDVDQTLGDLVSGAIDADAGVQALLAGLNEDLANEYAAVIQYRTYASAVSGPHRQELRAFFEGEIPDELGHAAYLADKIVALGGTPTVVPKEVKLTNDNKEMLQHALGARHARRGGLDVVGQSNHSHLYMGAADRPRRLAGGLACSAPDQRLGLWLALGGLPARVSPESWAYIRPQSFIDKYRFPANAEEAERYPNVDWQKELFKDYAMAYNGNLSVSGGNVPSRTLACSV